MLPVACTVRPPGELFWVGDGFRANGFVPVGAGCRGCCCCCAKSAFCCGCGAKGEFDCCICMEGVENGDEDTGGDNCNCCWSPVLCLAKGFVADRPRPGETIAGGLLINLGSAVTLILAGSWDWRNGLVDVCCGCSGSAIVGSSCCWGCRAKLGIPFCGIETRGVL